MRRDLRAIRATVFDSTSETPIPNRAAARVGPSARSLLLAAALLWLPACGAGDGTPEATPGAPSVGALVVIGGALHPDNEEIYRAILAGREGGGPLCVIPTAGGSPESSMQSAVRRIDRWGGEGTSEGILLTLEDPGAANDPEVVERIGGCSGFFFTGGAQSRILDFFLPEGEPTAAHEALFERFREGAVVSGSSAGAAMMSDPMISGGSSAGAFRDGVARRSEEEGVRIRPGMGFLDVPILDQHFLARGRIGRLLVTVLTLDDVGLGAGIDENTALLIEGDRARVIGASGVVLVDGRQARRSEVGPAGGSGLRVELLGTGDAIDLSTLVVTPGPGKRPLGSPAPAEGANAASAGMGSGASHPGAGEGEVFESWTFLHLLEWLGRSDEPGVTAPAEGHRIELWKGSDFRALGMDVEGVEGTPVGLSVGPLDVEIIPTAAGTSASTP